MKTSRTNLSKTRFGTFLGGNVLNDIAQGVAFSSITYLVLQNAGLAGVSLVQGVPLLIRIFGSPVLGAFADRFSARNVAVGAMIGSMLVALSCSWFNVYWYTLMMLANLCVMTGFETAYARLLPGVAGEEALDRASGIISVTTNVTKILSYAAGPLLAYFLGTGIFVVVAALLAGSAILFSRLPRSTGAIAGDDARAPGETGGAAAEQASGQASGQASDLSMLAKLREGVAYMMARGEFLVLVALLAIMNLAWGIDQVIAMKVAEDYLAVPSQWVGAYLSISSFGGVCGAFLISCGRITSRGRNVRKVGIAVLLFSFMASALLLTASPVVGFGLKFLAGSLSTVIGLLTQAALVLRAAPRLRGRLQALTMTISGVMMLVGKSTAGILSHHLSAHGIYTTMGLSVGALALAVLCLGILRGTGRAAVGSGAVAAGPAVAHA